MDDIIVRNPMRIVINQSAVAAAKQRAAEEHRLIRRFFKIVALFHESPCTESDCIDFAMWLLDTDELCPVDNQGAHSYTLISHSKNIVIQFRLLPLNLELLEIAYETYGDDVPRVTFHTGFPLPVYTMPAILGRVHVDQPFPDTFPLQREMQSVFELALFIASAAHHPQPPSADLMRTKFARNVLERIQTNEALKAEEPQFQLIARDLLSKLHLLKKLPLVLTHWDLSSVNIIVNDVGEITGVVDFDEAGIEPFGVSIWGLYETFLGEMDQNVWGFYDQPADDCSGRSVRQVLEQVFWDNFWSEVPDKLNRQDFEEAIMVALRIGIIFRYFIGGMVDGFDSSRWDHVLSLGYARGILLDL